MEEQQITDTSWIEADWHEKEPKKKRSRRNFLPEAYKRLPKKEKQQVRAAAEWIWQRVSHVDWGRKMPDKGAGKPVPKPVNLKDQVRPYLSGTWGKWVRKLTLTAVIRHLVEDDTCYFTGCPEDESLLCIDIDCHASGTLEGALQFAQYLKDNYFPNLYFETSTHGNGVHGFLVVDKTLWTDANYKATLKPMEEWLRRALRSTGFDVEDVELKGAPMTVSWGSRRGEVADLCYGSLAKMPRDWRRTREWLSTTRMTPHDLRKLPELFPVAEPEAKPEPKYEKPARKGSVSGKLVDPDEIRKLEPLARELLALCPPQVSSSSRAVVVAEDVQTALAVLRACTLKMNADGSMPARRVKRLWEEAYKAGDTTRAFSWHRFKAIRDMLTDLGLLEWEDSTYRFGHACQWRLGERLLEKIKEALSRSDTTTPFASPIVSCNMIAEARRERPEQVGLRPKRVYPSLLRTDWDAELTEAGLEHLSRTAA